MAPTSATLTMGYHELEFYEICQINWGRAFRKYIEENWGRFLDDCEILLEEDKVHPNALLEVLNSISPNIQFTMTCSKEIRGGQVHVKTVSHVCHKMAVFGKKI